MPDWFRGLADNKGSFKPPQDFAGLQILVLFSPRVGSAILLIAEKTVGGWYVSCSSKIAERGGNSEVYLPHGEE
jgi:hypothetical protein